MIGFAVETRCPDCKIYLDKFSVAPGARFIQQRRCPSRRCRGKPAHYFFIEHNTMAPKENAVRVRILTGAARERMIAEQDGAKTPSA